MKLLFRADASISIGLGHVMRCLTLADALTSAGAKCAFACRLLKGNVIEMLQNKGYEVFTLQDPDTLPEMEDDLIGLDIDARLTRAALQEFEADWLIVDHYQLDARWETAIHIEALSTLAIDDLPERSHNVDFLFDQNLGRSAADYNRLTNKSCHLVLGPEYALLRPQFRQHRHASLERRTPPYLRHLLIAMGGSDEVNSCGKILRVLQGNRQLLTGLESISIVMGSQAVWLEEISELAPTMPIKTDVYVDVQNMAAQMSRADLAIGAGGTTSWERCCLGVPSVVFSLADNQIAIAKSLGEAGAAADVGSIDSDEWQTRFEEAMTVLGGSQLALGEMSQRASDVIDGFGAARLCRDIFSIEIELS